ncbi:hypothetical protein A9Q84_02475 [Halobacteriovorax marinus]|uniref:Tetratricopeptide repeat protein n=1 Tax=Halobacteriovorax marinus TaxID=97084 RepID=A0A1Y5FI97_9BACT|nr:hypothetical protein A9Q84_02475 [Halobacteriovorax marinus]
MKVFLVSLLCLIFTGNSFAADERIKSAEQIERFFLDEMKVSKPTDTSKFYFYNLAAREFYSYKFYDKSLEYYELAIAMKVSEDKTEAFINLMAIEHAKKREITKKTYERVMKYLKGSGKIKEAGISRYMNFISESFFSDKPAKDFRGFFGQYSKDKSIKSYIKNKEYKKALSLINDKSVYDSDIVNRVQFDLLRSLVLGKAKFKLSCKSTLDKFPNSFAWSMKVCRTLVNYQKGRTPSSKDVSKIKSSLKKQSESRLYFAVAVEDLK